ncbi:hypothetical protein ACFL6M_04500 [Candidatus Eisenbacteria bacterium]|uniref:Flagellar protein FliS n=1 Tax=Eiseniibacteriota bacterium TaxID=2212470 RepID=A0ABV6YKI1_UNCEI
MQTPGIRAYRHQQLDAMKPEQLVLVVLEQGIRACTTRDHRRARCVFEQLTAALDFDCGEVSVGLLNLYDWALQLVREGRFGEAQNILEELRTAWSRAMNEALKPEEGLQTNHPGGGELPTDLVG